jgi:hypothetical protein
MSDSMNKDFLSGRVIDLESFRLTRTSTKGFGLKTDPCQHVNKTLDSNGGIITCDDCKKQLSPIWVIEEIISKWGEWWRRLESRAAQVKELEGKTVILKAAKEIEKRWRRKMAPCCPHCNRAILPEDRLGESAAVSFEYELARRARDKRTGN